MSGRRATSDDVAGALALVDGGMSIRAASRETGWSVASIRAWLHRRGAAPVAPPDASPVELAVTEARAEHMASAHLGRFPAILEPGKLDTLLRCVSKGMSLETSAARAGVTRQTVHGWMRHIEAGHEPYAQFGTLVAEAMARGVEELHDRILAGGPGWQGASWMLERRHRQEYGRAVQVQHSVGGPLEQLSDDDLLAIVRAWEPGAVDEDDDLE